MPKQNTPQLNKTIRTVNTGQIRAFVQIDPSPLETAEYYGRMNISDTFGTTRTESDVVFVPSDDYRNEWNKIGEIVRATERGTTSFTQLADQDLSEIWDSLIEYNLEFNVHLLVGDTQSPQDLTQWRSKFVLGNCRLTELTRGEGANPQTPDDNANFVLNGSLNFWDVYPIGTVELADLAGSTVTKNMNDVDIRLSDNKRYAEIFGITTSTTSTDPSAVVYVRVDDPTTISQTDITALGTDGEVAACAIVGSNFIAARNDGTEGHIYATLADIRAGNDNFTEVTTGYTASSGPNAIYVANTANILLAGDGGYVYKLSSVSANAVAKTTGGVTAQNLNDIDGVGTQVVAVGASSAIIVSNDLGNTWATATAPDTGLTLNAVSVVGEDEWFVATSAGALHYTNDGGTSWTEISLPGGATRIHDIEMYAKNANFYFGFLIADDGSNTLVYRTTDAGNTWNYTTPDLRNVTSVFSGVSAPSGLAVLNANEMVVVGDTVLAHGLN